MPNDKTQYRGYEVQLRQEWSNWCASIHPSRPELPLLAQSTLATLSRSKQEALASAKRSIDAALTGSDKQVA
jgi:hypothetical protein